MERPRHAARIGGIALVPLVALVLAACGTGGEGSEAPVTVAETVTATEPVAPVLSVLTLNVEYGGRLVSFDNVIAAIRLSGAQVVGINEAQGSTADVAAALGWRHYDPRSGIVSQLPLIPAGGDTRHVFVEVAPGRVVAVANVHLSSDPYGPELVAAGEDVTAVLANEMELRVPEVKAVLAPLEGLDPELPRLLIGDLNSPSHRDWTAAAVGSRPQLSYPVAWPVTTIVEAAGFVDAYRALLPDPVADAGLTWPAARPALDEGWNPPADAPADRIDYVFSAGPVEPIAVRIVGEVAPGVDITVDPWPTDHRGVVVDLRLTGRAVAPPPTVAPERLVVPIGDPLVVRVASAPDGARLRVEAKDGAVRSETEVADGAPLEIATTGWAPTEHRLRLLGGDGRSIADSTVWLTAPGAGVSLTSAQAVYAAGSPVRIGWYGAPANRWDWIGIYPRGADPASTDYLTWSYTGATVAGEAVLDGAAEGTWPLPAGRYSAYLLLDDGYEIAGRVDFAVN
ncbi:MAG: endonuclease/exonuclease/phosphatase family protein [Actinomycetota bacterium]